LSTKSLTHTTRRANETVDTIFLCNVLCNVPGGDLIPGSACSNRRRDAVVAAEVLRRVEVHHRLGVRLVVYVLSMVQSW
jgi:hypothetical protein